MATTDEWIDAGGQSEKTWDETGTIQGVYKHKKTGVGPHSSNVYVIATEDSDVDVWGSTVLDGRMEEVKVGSTVRIECLGKPAGKNYKNYKVQYKPAATVPAEVEQAFPGSEVV